MADNPTQDNQPGVLATPLGKDKLLLGRFDGVEGLGELFEYRIEALSTEPDLNFDDAIGRNASIHLETVDQVGRDFSGVLVETRRLGRRGALYVYSLALRPWLWLLSLTSDCRIFPNMTPKAIILQVFKDRNFSDIIDKANGDYPTLEYCVQYRETDLNFVLRLMEQYGIYYYFEHEKGSGGAPSKHSLVLADSASSHDKVPGLASVVYRPAANEKRRDRQQLDEWTLSRRIRSGHFVLNDYDYEKPGANLLVNADGPLPHPNGQMEMYDYPGDYKESDQGKKIADVYLRAEKLRDHRYSAVGSAPSLTPGYKIKRVSADDLFDPEDKEYLLLRCTHAYGYQSYQSGGAGAGGAAIYLGTYEMISSDRQFRMMTRTPWPTIYGSQSAKVVGKKGEEIDVDDKGRILVEFYWDRKKKPSRRVRVAQQWAGNNYGFVFTPRIGNEVLIQYLDGDPDRPLVVGSVYNGDNKMPGTMPADKNISKITTKSTKNSDGFNKLMFDDTTGEELVGLRAEKDLKVLVKHDESRTVGGNQTEDIGGSLTQTVGGDHKITVGGPGGGGNYTLTAMQKIELIVGANKLTIDQTGITLDALMITFKAKGVLMSQAPIINTKADGMIMSKAPLIMSSADGALIATAPATIIGQNVIVAPTMVVATITWGIANGAPPIPA